MVIEASSLVTTGSDDGNGLATCEPKISVYKLQIAMNCIGAESYRANAASCAAIIVVCAYSCKFTKSIVEFDDAASTLVRTPYR